MPSAYLITGPDYQGMVPGDMIHVKFRTNIGFVGLRIAVHGVDYSPIPFPDLTAPEELIHFDRLGSAMRYMLPTHADVNDTFVQTLGTIGLSVRKGFDWRSLDDSTLAGLRRAAPVIEQIADERWQTMS